MNGRRESNRKPPERQAAINRRAGVRSRYKRCDRCKKLRMYVLPNNWRFGDRGFGSRATEKFTDWKKLPDGTRICHHCVKKDSE